MADTVKLSTNGEIHEVEIKPITVICHNGTSLIKPVDDDIVVIEPQATVAFAEKLTDEEWMALREFKPFLEYWNCVFPKTEPPAYPIRDASLGYRHVVGLILLMSRALANGLRPYVRFPESYLHPSAQLGLADLFLKFQGGEQ